MKVVILAGGFGTRLSEYTHSIPKPMITIKGKPILYHIMRHYSNYGFNNFYIALGYKGQIIKNFFKKNSFGWNIKMVETGKKNYDGRKIKRLKKYLKNEKFLLTYGDGLSNVNIKKLVKFHEKKNKLVTLTAVRPPARFGAIKLKGDYVTYFKEKSKLDEGWINGGFFVIEPKFIDLIKNDKTFFGERAFRKSFFKKTISCL